jgi:hypothetical protein
MRTYRVSDQYTVDSNTDIIVQSSFTLSHSIDYFPDLHSRRLQAPQRIYKHTRQSNIPQILRGFYSRCCCRKQLRSPGVGKQSHAASE